MYIPPLSSLLPSVLLAGLLGPDRTTKPPLRPPKLAFRPVHAHASSSHRTSDVLFSNEVHSPASIAADPAYLDTPLPHLAGLPLSVRTKRQVVRRPINNSRDRLNEYRRRSLLWQESTQEEWEDVEVDVPDVTDRQTIITLAKMSSNAYVAPDTDEWWPLDGYNAVGGIVERADLSLSLSDGSPMQMDCVVTS